MHENTQAKTQKRKTLNISFTEEQFNILDRLSKATKMSKSQLVNKVLEESGIFDVKKVNKKLEGVEDEMVDKKDIQLDS